MKILVFLHELVFGGTAVNSIELAAALSDLHGHDTFFFSTPGPVQPMVEASGLRFLPAPPGITNPSPARMSALREVVRRERPDLLHVWETWACFDAYYGVHLTMGIPMLVTDMQMFVSRRYPKLVTTTFGTPELVDRARAQGRSRIELLLPPVDVRSNAPGAVDPAPFRNWWGFGAGDINIVTVSRLADSMKTESLLRTIDAVGTLGGELPLRFVIVGDGDARQRVEERAAKINAALGRSAVVLTGAMLDPREAYAAADIVVGMGSSALRGMAFGKPVIVVGERGFSAPFVPETAQDFYYRGLYGVGDGAADNVRLVQAIRHLAARRAEHTLLGEFSRHFVVEHFSLESVSARLSMLCAGAAADRPPKMATALDALRSSAVYLRERRFMMRASPSRRTETRDA